MQENLIEGLLLVDKPKGWTSFDVVKKARGILGIRKIGHAGTLDPMAEGLLILMVGKATKKFDDIGRNNKEYWAKITLGNETDTYDAEGRVTKKHIGEIDIKEVKLKEILKSFEGIQEQTPPKYSALKIGGVPAYKRARKGEDVKIKKREIFIEKIELVRMSLPDVYLKIVCSSGTYIRTIALDLGRKLGFGAYLSGLKRVRIGNFDIKDSVSPDKISVKELIKI